jgi:hypothetical protein
MEEPPEELIGGKNESVSKVRKIVEPPFLSGIWKEKSCYPIKTPLSV